MPEHVFISFCSADQEQASSVYDKLQSDGIQCWASFRDVSPGHNYQAAIVAAMQNAQAVILVFSSRTNLSQEVNKELSLASAFKMRVIPLRIEDAVPEGALRYELATRQWIDAFKDWDSAMGNLVAAIRGVDQPASRGEGAPQPASASTRRTLVISDRAIETARLALTHYIGPIAMVLVKKVAAGAASLDEFHERLASHITAPENRTAFLLRVRRSQR